MRLQRSTASPTRSDPAVAVAAPPASSPEPAVVDCNCGVVPGPGDLGPQPLCQRAAGRVAASHEMDAGRHSSDLQAVGRSSNAGADDHPHAAGVSAAKPELTAAVGIAAAIGVLLVKPGMATRSAAGKL